MREPPPGTLDASFGNAGTIILSKGSNATGVALQADGKILVAAGGWIVRYDRSGTPDPTFGSGGFAPATAPGSDAFGVRHVASQTDGKIVTAGSYVRTGGGGAFHCALVRYASDGSIDPAFGDAGLVVWNPRATSAIAPTSQYSAMAASSSASTSESMPYPSACSPDSAPMDRSTRRSG